MADMSDGFHSAARPQESLQGDMGPIHTQMPATSESMTNPRSAAPDNVDGSWTGFLAPHPTVPANSNPVH
ncbi:hypothetical protein D7294_30365 [Streptomyces hoynatensis]|uniref:Uncharacterized protein n=1 Tax=Streptomyces hoynatensis TaxID=1141874 RepID=A0A3A9YMV8_9ACTN|nr:hypothetical protein D7294_30365 [Streptomyces hoynatensis]